MTAQSILKRPFLLDYRSLALFRAGLGLVVLIDLISRAFDFTAFHTDVGVLPRSFLFDDNLGHWELTFHAISGGPTVQALLFLIAAGFAIALALGYHTRLAAVGSWIFAISLQHRNPMILQGADVLLRNLLFLSIFLPLGRAYSLDARLSEHAETPPPLAHFSVGTVALVAQIILVYVFSALLKGQDTSWIQGKGLYYAMSDDQLTTFLAPKLLRFPALLKFMSLFTLNLEFLGPLLLLIPWANGPIRTLIVFAFWGLHINIAILLKIGIFPLVCVVAWSALLPSWFWEKLKIKAMPVSREITEMMPFREAVFVCFCLCYITVWNFETLPRFQHEALRRYQWFGFLLGLDQRWNMFSRPIVADGWFVIPGVLKNHEHVDLFTKAEPPVWDQPESISSTFRGDRWRKYMLNLLEDENQRHLLYYGRYLCRDWNMNHTGPRVLETFQVVFMRRNILPEGGKAPVERVPIWTHECFDGAFRDYPEP